jgi:hypothetical protein
MRIVSMVVALMLMVSSNLIAAEKTYGKGISLTKITKISKLLENPSVYEGKKVLVEGLITSVCESRGCWMYIASDKNFQEIKIKVLDGVIVFPMSAQGKMAKVEGVLEDVNNLDSYEKKNPKHQYAKKKEQKAKSEYRIRALGAVIAE